MIYLKYGIYFIVWNFEFISSTHLNLSYSYLNWMKNCFPQNIKNTTRSCRNLLHSRRWSKTIPPIWEKHRSLVRFYSKAQKSPGFSMHECNAHVCVLAICCPTISGCYTTHHKYQDQAILRWLFQHRSQGTTYLEFLSTEGAASTSSSQARWQKWISPWVISRRQIRVSTG